MEQDRSYQRIKEARRTMLALLFASSAFKDAYYGVIEGSVLGLLHVEFVTIDDACLFEARVFASMDIRNLPLSTLLVSSPHVPDMSQRIRSGMSREHYLDMAFERQKGNIARLLFQQLDNGGEKDNE